MSAAPEQCCPAGKFRTCLLSRPTRFEVAIPIGKTNYAIRIRHEQKLGIVTRRIKCNAERLVQIAFGKYFDDIWFTAAFCVAQHFDLIGTTLSDEDVSIWSSKQKSRIAKTAAVHIDPKTGRNPKLSVRWSLNHAGQVNCQNI